MCKWGEKDSPSDNNHLLLGLGHRAFGNRSSLSGLNVRLCSADINRAILFKDLECVQGVEGRGIFDVSGVDIEACCTELAFHVIYHTDIFSLVFSCIPPSKDASSSNRGTQKE